MVAHVGSIRKPCSVTYVILVSMTINIDDDVNIGECRYVQHFH